MVYGIIELINFAHGDVFMLGSFLALALIGAVASWRMPNRPRIWHGRWRHAADRGAAVLRGAERDDRPRRLQTAAPRAKLAPLVSAIGVSFVLMNVGLLWGGPADRHFPDLVSRQNLLADNAAVSASPTRT